MENNIQIMITKGIIKITAKNSYRRLNQMNGWSLYYVKHLIVTSKIIFRIWNKRIIYSFIRDLFFLIIHVPLDVFIYKNTVYL